MFLFVQQRGERDSQNQAVLTKLKCAAGKQGGDSRIDVANMVSIPLAIAVMLA